MRIKNLKKSFASIRELTRRASASVLCPLSFVLLTLTFLGCDCQRPSTVVVVTNAVTVTREVVVTNSVTVTNVVIERREPLEVLTVRKTAPFLVSSSILSHRQLKDALTAGAARVLSLDRTAVVEANEKILSAIAEKGAGTVSIRPLGVEAKLVRGAEAGGRVIVRPVSAMDRPAVVAAVKSLGGEVLPASPVAEQGALVCKLSRKAVLGMAARPDVWSIERYGK